MSGVVARWTGGAPRTTASRCDEGVEETAVLEWKVCIMGLVRLAMLGWGVGRWVV